MIIAFFDVPGLSIGGWLGSIQALLVNVQSPSMPARKEWFSPGVAAF